MTPDEVRQLVEVEIGYRWDSTNDHGVDLRKSLIHPHKIRIIERTVIEGKVRNEERDVWRVLGENDRDGYQIVFDESRQSFGLARQGFPTDKHMVLVGWYGDFMTTFSAM